MIWIRWRYSRPVSTEQIACCVKKYVDSLSGSDFLWITRKEIAISTKRAWTDRNSNEHKEFTAVWVSWYPVADRSSVTHVLLPQDCRTFYQLPRQGFLVLPEVLLGCPEPPLQEGAGLLLFICHQNPVGIPVIPGHLQCLIDTPSWIEHQRTHLTCWESWLEANENLMFYSKKLQIIYYSITMIMMSADSQTQHSSWFQIFTLLSEDGFFPCFYPIAQSRKGHLFVSAYVQISKLFFLHLDVVAFFPKHYICFQPHILLSTSNEKKK